MPSNHYDIIVAGEDLTGLALGAAASKAGYRVLVMGQGSLPASYKHKGVGLTRRPVLFSGISSSTMVKEFLKNLGINLIIRNKTHAISPYLQVVTPKTRFSFTKDKTLLHRELGREFPGEEKLLMGIMEDIWSGNDSLERLFGAQPILPGTGLFERRDVAKLAAALLATEPEDGDLFPRLSPRHRMRSFAQSLCPYSAMMMPSEYSPSVVRHLLGRLHGDLSRFDGGLDNFKQVLRDTVTKNSGDVAERNIISGMYIRRGKVIEVKSRLRQDTIGCDALVVNTDLKRFFSLIPPEDQKEKFFNRLRMIQPAGYLFVMNHLIRGDTFLEGMGQVVGLELQGELADAAHDTMLMMMDPDLSTGDSSVLTTAVLLDARTVQFDPDYVEHTIEAGIIEALTRFNPFYPQIVQWTHCPLLNDEGKVDPAELVPIYGAPLDNSLGLTTVPLRTDYKNIYIATDHLYGALGLEGNIFAATCLLKLLRQKLGRK